MKKSVRILGALALALCGACTTAQTSTEPVARVERDAPLPAVNTYSQPAYTPVSPTPYYIGPGGPQDRSR